MPGAKYRLHYFDAMGAAEPLRLIFHAAKVDFEDVRISREQWPSVKATIPSGQVPYLETPDSKPGEGLSQSAAIGRYLSRKYGFYPKDAEKVYKCERAYELLRDVMTEGMKIYFGSDESARPALLKEFESGKLATSMAELKRYMDESGGDFFVANDVTFADFVLLSIVDTCKSTLSIDLRGQYEFVRKHYDAVLKKQPEVAQYIATRK